MAKQTAVIEIGSSKVICLVAGKNNSELVIRGIGICGYSGGYKYDPYKGVELPDERELYDAMRRAVQQARQECGDIDSAVIAFGTPFLRVLVMRGELVVSKPRSVMEEDEYSLGNISRNNTDQTGYTYIHSTAISYYVDGAPSVNLPIGERIEKSISAEISHVYVNSQMAALAENALNELGISRRAFVATPLAQAHYLIPADYENNPSLLVDVGYTHTDMACVKNETLIDIQPLALGGKHFSSDIAAVMGISLTSAEGIKRRYAFGHDYTGMNETVKNADGDVEYLDKEYCSQIIIARMNELCECILDYMKDLDIDAENTDVYLTGGGVLMMQGALEYMRGKGINVISDIPSISRKQHNTPNNVSAFAVARFVINSGIVNNSFSVQDGTPSLWKRLFVKKGR